MLLRSNPVSGAISGGASIGAAFGLTSTIGATTGWAAAGGGGGGTNATSVDQPQAYDNMTLVSEEQTAATEPSTGRLMIYEEDTHLLRIVANGEWKTVSFEA